MSGPLRETAQLPMTVSNKGNGADAAFTEPERIAGIAAVASMQLIVANERGVRQGQLGMLLHLPLRTLLLVLPRSRQVGLAIGTRSGDVLADDSLAAGACVRTAGRGRLKVDNDDGLGRP